MQRLAGLLRSKVPARRPQVIVVEHPNQGRPRIVLHFLQDAGGNVFVPAVGFIHGPLSLVIHDLRLPGKVFHSGGFSVTGVQGLCIDLDVFEYAAARVEVPIFINGPQVIGRYEFPQTLEGGNGWAGAGFRNEPESPTVLLVGQPIGRRNIVIRPGHFQAGRTGDGCRLFRGRRQIGIRPVLFLQDLDVHLSDFFRRRVVIAVEPAQDAGMITEPADPVTQGFHGNSVVFVPPVLPFFPMIAATPTRHQEHTVAVGEIQKVVVLEFAIHAQHVQIHVASVADLRLLPFWRQPQKHIGPPARAAHEHFLAVHPEQAVTLGCQFGRDLTNPEADLLAVGNLTVDAKIDFHFIEILRSHLPRPPQARVGQVEFRELLRGKSHPFRFMRREFNLLSKMDVFDLACQHSFHGVFTGVFEVGVHGEARFLKRRHVDLGDDLRKAQRHGPTGVQVHFLP